MGFRYAVLIVLAIMTTGGTNAGKTTSFPNCLSCHVSHNSDRGSCVDCHRGNPRTNRKNIAHTNLIHGKYAFFSFSTSRQLKNGRQSIERFGCRRCHTISGKGNQIASNLDLLFMSSSPEKIDKAIRFPAQQMPDFRFTDQQRSELVNVIESAGRTAGAKHLENPQKVHFSNQDKRSENSFEKKCGECHKLLSSRFGGLGRGNIGPNLTGLFTVFYPGKFRAAEPWNNGNLQKWLQNPRAIRPNSAMRPVVIKNKVEIKEILEIVSN